MPSSRPDLATRFVKFFGALYKPENEPPHPYKGTGDVALDQWRHIKWYSIHLLAKGPGGGKASPNGPFGFTFLRLTDYKDKSKERRYQSPARRELDADLEELANIVYDMVYLGINAIPDDWLTGNPVGTGVPKTAFRPGIHTGKGPTVVSTGEGETMLEDWRRMGRPKPREPVQSSMPLDQRRALEALWVYSGRDDREVRWSPTGAAAMKRLKAAGDTGVAGEFLQRLTGIGGEGLLVLQELGFARMVTTGALAARWRATGLENRSLTIQERLAYEAIKARGQGGMRGQDLVAPNFLDPAVLDRLAGLNLIEEVTGMSPDAQAKRAETFLKVMRGG